MKDFNFDQANALVRRMLENNAGGSANAYDVPIEPREPTIEEPPSSPSTHSRLSDLLGSQTRVPSPLEEEEIPPSEDPLLEDEDICIDGIVDWKEVDDRVWTNPPPITDEYRLWGVVEDSDELLAIHEGFQKASHTQRPQHVVLEAGTYLVDKPRAASNWCLKDTSKDHLYFQDHPTEYLGIVHPDDLFLWVKTTADRDSLDLGYIHMGYVFLRK